jgi:uncharacterized protein YjiS (DUF1127 family)
MFLSRTIRRANLPPANLFRHLRKALALYRQRQYLARLDAHMLRDIGLTAEQAQAEANQPFWHAPAHWTQHQP